MSSELVRFPKKITKEARERWNRDGRMMPLRMYIVQVVTEKMNFHEEFGDDSKKGGIFRL